ncbi:MAG TPA: tetratricopeptide repeat protein, partial [Flavobacteriales bacterium]|nr:tetratricopeptide repeat protein [Flavobacteriales bacterium]
LGSLGISNWKRGNFKAATKNYLEALALNEKTNDTRKTLMLLMDLGLLHSEQKEYAMALDYMYAGKKLFTPGIHEREKGMLLNGLGTVYSKKYRQDNKKQNIDSAFTNYNRALAIYEPINYKPGIAEVYNNLATLFLFEKKTDKAIAYQLKDLEISRGLNDAYSVSISLHNLAHMYSLKNDFTKALKLENEALAICIKHNYTDNLINVYVNLADFYAKTGDFKQAYVCGQRHMNLYDSLQGIETSRALAEMSARYQAEKKQSRIDSLSRENKIKALKNRQKEAELVLSNNIRNWVIFISISVLLVIAIWIVAYRNKQQRKRFELERLNLKIEQDMLRTQMNPHFIFNALNSIQSFISEQQGYEAQRFLSKFAQLVRYVLEYNTEEYVSLDDDLNVLEIYLELEQLRFNKKFEFQVIKNIEDAGSYQIPPMIAQPFVENAILHGLQHLNGNGKLVVQLHAQNDDLTLTISDNGIGRQKSAMLRKNTPGKKQSMGMNLVRQRLDLLNSKRKTAIHWTIEDLCDTKNQPAGTRVNILIPFDSSISVN